MAKKIKKGHSHTCSVNRTFINISAQMLHCRSDSIISLNRSCRAVAASSDFLSSDTWSATVSANFFSNSSNFCSCVLASSNSRSLARFVSWKQSYNWLPTEGRWLVDYQRKDGSSSNCPIFVKVYSKNCYRKPPKFWYLHTTEIWINRNRMKLTKLNSTMRY